MPAASGHHKAARAPSACTLTACVTFGAEVPPTRRRRLTSTGDRRRTSSWRGGTTRTCGRLCRASTSGRAPQRQDLAGFSLDAGGHASSLDSVHALLRSAISRASSGDPAAAQAPTSCSAREPLPTRTLSSTRVCSRQSGFCSCLWLLLARPPLRRIFMCSPPGAPTARPSRRVGLRVTRECAAARTPHGCRRHARACAASLCNSVSPVRVACVSTLAAPGFV